MSYVVCPENVQKCICHDVASEASNLVSIASKLSAGASWQKAGRFQLVYIMPDSRQNIMHLQDSSQKFSA